MTTEPHSNRSDRANSISVPLGRSWSARAIALAVALFTLLAVGLYISQRAQAATPVKANAAVASKSVKRSSAYRYALTQKGDWYRYGGNGPSSWDCSGLVKWAYKRAGVSLPRVSYSMLHSHKLRRTTRPVKGDLAFFSGGGHVEFYVSGSRTKGVTFGAHHFGTRIGYRKYNKYYHPTVFMTLR